MNKTLQGKYAERLEKENKKLKDKINKAIEYVRKLSSKGRDCEIYYDIKKEILNLLGDKENDK